MYKFIDTFMMGDSFLAFVKMRNTLEFVVDYFKCRDYESSLMNVPRRLFMRERAQ